MDSIRRQPARHAGLGGLHGLALFAHDQTDRQGRGGLARSQEPHDVDAPGGRPSPVQSRSQDRDAWWRHDGPRPQQARQVMGLTGRSEGFRRLRSVLARRRMHCRCAQMPILPCGDSGDTTIGGWHFSGLVVHHVLTLSQASHSARRDQAATRCRVACRRQR